MKDLSAFTKPVVEMLAKRAGQQCSNPDCNRSTSGGHSEQNKAVIVGEAAHIYGQKPDSKRYDALMTDEERRHISNGIWLCRLCHKRIDSDEIKYPAKLLFKWKEAHENGVLNRVKGDNKATMKQLSYDIIDFCTINGISGFPKDDELQTLHSLAYKVEKHNEFVAQTLRQIAEKWEESKNYVTLVYFMGSIDTPEDIKRREHHTAIMNEIKSLQETLLKTVQEWT